MDTFSPFAHQLRGNEHSRITDKSSYTALKKSLNKPPWPPMNPTINTGGVERNIALMWGSSGSSTSDRGSDNEKKAKLPLVAKYERRGSKTDVILPEDFQPCQWTVICGR